MADIPNSEVIKTLLQKLIKSIERRDSHELAVNVITNAIKDLREQYAFLEYIRLEDEMFTEGADSVRVLQDINSVDTAVFYQGLEDLIKLTVRYLEKVADYYFIKEFQEAISDIDDDCLRDKNIDLRAMQSEYIVQRKDALKTKNSELSYFVLPALVRTLKRKMPTNEAFQTLNMILQNLEQKYPFLQYISFVEKPGEDGAISIEVKPEIDTIWTTEAVEAVQKIIEEVGKLSIWDQDKDVPFIEQLTNEFNEEQLAELKSLSISLEHIGILLLRKGHEALTRRTVEILVELVSNFDQESNAIIEINNIVRDLEKKHAVLEYIQIDTERSSEGAKAIDVNSEVNSIEPHTLGKALRDVIKMTRRNLASKSNDFIGTFKNKLGDEQLVAIENMGINLHFLEMEV